MTHSMLNTQDVTHGSHGELGMVNATKTSTMRNVNMMEVSSRNCFCSLSLYVLNEKYIIPFLLYRHAQVIAMNSTLNTQDVTQGQMTWEMENVSPMRIRKSANLMEVST